MGQDKTLSVPAIRFPEFVDMWSNTKLKTLFTTVTTPVKMDNEQTYELVTVKRNLGGIVSRGLMLGKDIKVKSQFYLKAGCILFSKRQISHKACGVVPEEFNGAIVSNEYSLLEPNEHLSAAFFFLYCYRPNMYQSFYLSSIGVHIEKMIFKLDDWLTRQFPMPSLPEQEKIANFLSDVDAKIENLAKQKECMQQYKKGCMQKLFSQEIRFKSDDGKSFPDWEEKKLGQIFSEVTTRGNNADELLSVTLNQGVVKRKTLDGKNNASNDRSNYKKVKKGDIAYNSMRMWQGASGVSNYEGIVSPAYTVIECSSGYYPSFFAYFFKWAPIISLFRRNSQGLTSDTWNCKYPLFSKIKATIPKSKDEQVKISNFLSVLDDKIEILDKQLEAMKEFKKGLLQGMFV